jgi:hypothetical protein
LDTRPTRARIFFVTVMCGREQQGIGPCEARIITYTTPTAAPSSSGQETGVAAITRIIKRGDTFTRHFGAQQVS